MLKKILDPDRFVFVFDLHGVLFFRYWRSIFSGLFNMPEKRVFKYFFNPLFLFNFCKIASRTSVSDEICEFLSTKFSGFSRFEKDFFNLENSLLAPNHEAFEFLGYLKENGFKIYLLSNIGSSSLSELKKKFPGVLDVFNGFFVPQKEAGYLHKPSPDFFKAFLDYLVLEGESDKKVVFIDDKKKNLESAIKLDFICFHFSSISKLGRDLSKLAK